MRYFIYSYNRYSESAKALKKTIQGKGLKCTIVTQEHQPRLPKATDLVINWGNSQVPNFVCNWLYNSPVSVSLATNKLEAFTRFKEAGVPIPRFTTDRNEAREWGTPVVCRKLLRASGGRGIVLADTVDQIVESPLYVQYRKKTHEYRVHVVHGTITLIHQKRRRGVEHRGPNYNPRICNHDNSWVFCIPTAPVPDCVKSAAIQAISAVNLEFGGVDIIYNSKFDKCYVLEINTAPGFSIGSATAFAYANALTGDNNAN